MAKKHCPDKISQLPIPNNDGLDKRHSGIFVKLSDDVQVDDNVSINDWLENKEQLLEWTLDLHKDSSCRGKIRDMEKEMSKCADESFILSSL